MSEILSRILSRLGLMTEAEHHRRCDRRERVYVEVIEARASQVEAALGLPPMHDPGCAGDYWRARWDRILAAAGATRRTVWDRFWDWVFGV